RIADCVRGEIRRAHIALAAGAGTCRFPGWQVLTHAWTSLPPPQATSAAAQLNVVDAAGGQGRPVWLSQGPNASVIGWEGGTILRHSRRLRLGHRPPTSRRAAAGRGPQA